MSRLIVLTLNDYIILIGLEVTGKAWVFDFTFQLGF